MSTRQLIPRAHRKTPNLMEKLAASLLEIAYLRGGDEARSSMNGMTAKQIVSLYDFDHWPIPVANGGTNEPQNLKPRLRAEHREKTRRDIATIAKGKRVRRKMLARTVEQERFASRLLAPPEGSERGGKVRPRLRKKMNGQVINTQTGEVVGGRRT